MGITCLTSRAMKSFLCLLILSTTLCTLYWMLDSSVLICSHAMAVQHSSAAPQTQNLDLATFKKLETVFKHLNETRETGIFPPFQIGEYLLLNPSICKDTPRVHIIILVRTATGHFEQRRRMRRTFANSSSLLPFQIRTAFLLGRARDVEIQRKMELEHALYKDSIMGDFVDDYRNLTLKGILGFRWVREYCPNSDIVYQIDDDLIVDMYRVIQVYTGYLIGKQKSLFCEDRYKDPIQRDGGRWRLQPHLFQNLTKYPYLHCMGYAAMITSDLMDPLYQASKIAPFFWIDDIYLYGILPKLVGNVTFHSFRLGKYTSWGGHGLQSCLERRGHLCEMFAAVLGAGDDFDRIWEKIQEVHKNEKKFPPVEYKIII